MARNPVRQANGKSGASKAGPFHQPITGTHTLTTTASAPLRARLQAKGGQSRPRLCAQIASAATVIPASASALTLPAGVRRIRCGQKGRKCIIPPAISPAMRPNNASQPAPLATGFRVVNLVGMAVIGRNSCTRGRPGDYTHRPLT